MKIELKGICKKFNSNFCMDELSITIQSKDFVTFLGPSGCGKTTILRMIAGLENPDEGEIWFDNSCVFSTRTGINVPPERRNIGFVFQDFALWPHMKVYENVAFPLRARHQIKDLDQKVRDALKAVRLEGFEDRYPEQLSGGQQQRVAFARAITGKPGCILFDEPLSALDAVLREEMRMEIKKLTSEMGITAIFVTHDQMEAMSMSDSVVIMNKGRIEQYGSPEAVYNYPKTKFIANFIGRSNWIDENTMFRPEAVSLKPKEDYIPYEAEIMDQQFLGNTYEIHLHRNGKKWVVQCPKKQQEAKMLLYINSEKIKTFTK